MGLQRRVVFIKQQYNVDCTVDRLRAFYQRNNVTYRVTSTNWRVDNDEQEILEQQRRQFALKLHTIKQRNLPIVYFDECSFNNWQVK